MTITATCGHVLPPGSMGNAIYYRSEYCHAIDGFQPCEVWSCVCDDCLPKYREWYPDGFKVLEPPEPQSDGK